MASSFPRPEPIVQQSEEQRNKRLVLRTSIAERRMNPQRHREPSGRANARPMPNFAKQSKAQGKQSAGLLRRFTLLAMTNGWFRSSLRREGSLPPGTGKEIRLY